jgi:hypothetical protein
LKAKDKGGIAFWGSIYGYLNVTSREGKSYKVMVVFDVSKQGLRLPATVFDVLYLHQKRLPTFRTAFFLRKIF